MGLFSRWSFNLAFLFAAAIYIIGLNIDVLEADSAQYASISEEMNRTGSYLEVYHNGGDYLDKPPILFWISALMFKLFGVANWSFKVGSFIISIIGIISTYKLGYLLYNKRIGFIAAVMLTTCQAFFLFNSDVRTDAILTGSVAFAVWQIVAYLYTHKWKNLILGFIAIGVAMMAKGPIGLMVPALAIGSYLIGRQQYKDIFRWQWLVGLAITAIVISPMCYGLYTQYDLHPEKELTFFSDAGNHIRTGVSGLRFYFWEQSFGRITGENVWKDGSGPFFFLGIFAYSFLPWAILGFMAITWRIYNTIIDLVKTDKKQEWLTLGGFLLPFIAFSMSSYKLDHYIYVTFPFAAIITSEYVMRIVFEKPKWWINALIIIQTVVIIVSIILGILILTLIFPTSNILIWAGFLILVGASIAVYFSPHKVNKIVLASVFASLAANWVLNLNFFPILASEYQPGKELITYVEENDINFDDLLISSRKFRFQYNYLAQQELDIINPQNIQKLDLHNVYYFAYNEEELQELEELGVKFEVLKRIDTFHVTMLSPEFLNPKTRDSVLNAEYLVKIL